MHKVGLEFGKHFSICPLGTLFCCDKHSSWPTTLRYCGGNTLTPRNKGLQSFPLNFCCIPSHAHTVQLDGFTLGKQTSWWPPLLLATFPKQSSWPSTLKYAGGIPVSDGLGLQAGGASETWASLLKASSC